MSTLRPARRRTRTLTDGGSGLVLPKVDVPVEPRALVRARARFRAKLVGGLLGVALLAMGARGASLCLEPADRVVRAGSMQRYDDVVLRARRGEIYDRDGRRLATSVDTPSVAVDPSLLAPEDVPELAEKVASILGLPVTEVREKLERQTQYAKLAANVHPSVAAEIERLDHRALFSHRDPKRYYPEETLASQVVGFVDASGSGRSGLEESLDEYLRGGSVVLQRRRDRKGLDVDRPAASTLDTNQGMDVHTTIDRQVQRITERALEKIVESSDPVSVAAVVVDVKTGDILALANAPTFNPNAIGDDPAPRKNHVVTDAIEPGSIYKPFTIAAAVDQGIVQPTDLVDCEGGYYAIGRSRIRDDHPHDIITLGEVMKYSSNIGTAKLAFRLGAETFIDYLHRFGFGARTGIQLPGERRGRIRDPETIKPIELATTSFGQGTTTTPLQLAMGIAAIANGGVLMKPRLVTRIEDGHGIPEYVQRPTVVQRAISEPTALKVREMMALVTEDGGTGTRARIPGYRVAGKTGTAQKVKDGRYSEARIGSFVGFVPADDPVIAIVVVVDEPRKGSRYGGIVAAPAFAEIGGATLRHLGVPPDPALIPPPKVSKRAKAPAPEAPVDDDAVAEADELRVAWTGQSWSLPDLRGRSMRDVLSGLEGTGLRVAVAGSGVAVAQEPPPGTAVSPGETLTVTFQ